MRFTRTLDPANPLNRIDQLRERGLFSALDVHFSRFLARVSKCAAPEFALAAALVSRWKSVGNICIDLASLAGKSLPGGEAFIPALPDLRPWIDVLEANPTVGKPGDYRPLVLDGTRLYLYRYWDYEKSLAEWVKARVDGFQNMDEPRLRNSIQRLFPESGPRDMQRVAAFAALAKRFCVISGGPGTGKTFTVAKVLALLLEQARENPPRIALAAPTGKAAARLQEAIRNAREGLDCPQDIKDRIPGEASTIHRLLGSLPKSPSFLHNPKNPLPVDVAVVDEASMADLALLAKLVQAVPPKARLILLGDRDQLASVEAGAALGDICDTGRVHGFSRDFCDRCERVTGTVIEPSREGVSSGIRDCIVELDRSYRFGDTSGIGAVSRAVKEGEGERALALMRDDRFGDISWKKLHAPDVLARPLRERALRGFSAYLEAEDPGAAFELFNRFRIFCALREGPYGIHSLNILVESFLRREGLIRPDSRWYAGRPVMIIRNDYGLRLYNGDVGIVLPDRESDGKPRVFFPAAEGGFRRFPPSRLPEHETVYAMTVHKSQGSEFDNVLLVLPDRDNPVLTRELLYTAVTRARTSVEVWGKEDVFLAAASRRIARASGLRDALYPASSLL